MFWTFQTFGHFPLPLKVPLHVWVSAHVNTRFLGPTRVHTQNGISIGSAIFEELMTVTDRGL